MATNKFEQSNFASSAVKAQAVVLDLVIGFNNSTTDTLYFQLFDADALPADGETPVRSFVVGPKGSFSYAPSQHGRKFDPGLVWAVSSTPDELTIAAAAEWFVTLEGRVL